MLACGNEEPTELSFNQKRYVDSISRIHMNTMDSVLESICDQQFDSLVQVNFDSLFERRIYEINRIENKR